MKAKKLLLCVIILSLCVCIGWGFKGIELPDNMEEENEVLREKEYGILDFPYYYDESKEVLDYFKEVIAGDTEEYCFLTKGAFTPQYKRTVDAVEKTYLYFGKLKNEKPMGIGVIFKYENSYYYPAVIGNFKDGYVNGYALCFKNMILNDAYEGEYSKGEASGKGIQYTYCWIHLNEDNFSVEDSISECKEVHGYKIVTNLFMPINEVSYCGEMSDGKANGKGRTYDCEGRILFDGTWKKGEKKEGIDYLNGQKIYEGQYKYGLYHGKGTLYDAEGNVEYKGEFRNGDIK